VAWVRWASVPAGAVGEQAQQVGWNADQVAAAHKAGQKMLLTFLRLWLTLENCSYGCGLTAMRYASSLGYVEGRVLQVREP
jgi:hypothetical protein